MHTNYQFRSRDRRDGRSPRGAGSAGLTLVELLAVITIIAILASVIFVVSLGMRKKAEQVACGRNLSTIHLALRAYLTDYKRWPQVPPPDGSRDEEKYWQDWFTLLERYDLTEDTWMCPTHRRATPKEEFLQYSSYQPMTFDGKSDQTPYLYSNMPWAMEIGDNHGDGPLIIMPDGSIQSGMSIEKPHTSLRKR